VVDAMQMLGALWKNKTLFVRTASSEDISSTATKQSGHGDPRPRGWAAV